MNKAYDLMETCAMYDVKLMIKYNVILNNELLSIITFFQ